MKNLKQRIASGALAGALAVSLAVPAFASSKNSTKVTGTYQEIVINVTVPTTGTAQINPYALNVKLDDASSITGQQIVTMPLAIANKSDMKLDVNATVTGEVKGNFKFNPKSTVTGEDETPLTTNSAFVYLEMKKSALANADLDTTDKAVQGFNAETLYAEVAAWAKSDYKPDLEDETTLDAAKVIVGTKAAEGKKLVTLEASNSDGELQDGSVALFRLSGDCVKSPKTAWTKADGFTATIAFTFDVNTDPATP
jgi:hypothetical protein